MNYKDFNLGDWIGHISGVIEDETTLDGNEMRDLVEFLSTMKKEPCTDCIKREDALMALTGEWTEPTDEIIHRFVKRIKSLPLVTPAEKTGRWEWVQYDGNPSIGNWHCSECRTIFIEGIIKREKDSIPFYKYCPQCGAKMEEGSEE